MPNARDDVVRILGKLSALSMPIVRLDHSPTSVGLKVQPTILGGKNENFLR